MLVPRRRLVGLEENVVHADVRQLGTVQSGHNLVLGWVVWSLAVARKEECKLGQ